MRSPTRMDSQQISDNLKQLNATCDHEWKIENGNLYKVFVFENFNDAMAFMQAGGECANTLDHHPDWCNSYNKVVINLITHQTNHISMLDFELATELDKLYQARFEQGVVTRP